MMVTLQKCPICGTPLILATDGKLHASYQYGCGGIKIGITGLTRPDKDGEIRKYVPCKRNVDGAEGFICPETGDFICISRASEEGE
jgi:predicted RNA-binding Zn-ribbon protein involved in translation (DUF1610 family)